MNPFKTKSNSSPLFSKVLLGLFVLSLFACSKEKERNPLIIEEAPKGDNSGRDLANAGDSSDYEDTARNEENSMAGTWKVTSVTYPAEKPQMKFIKDLLTNGNQIIFQIEKEPGKGSLEVISKKASACKIKLEYDIAYCCPKMRKLFLEEIKGSASESESGCTQTQFNTDFKTFAENLSRSVELTYHFTHYQSHLVIQGAYEDQSTKFHLLEEKH
jgi:hypothetical protein